MVEWSKTILVLACALLLALPNQLSAQAKANAVFNPARIESGDTVVLRVLVSGVKVAPKRVSFAAWLKQVPTDNILRRSNWSRSGAHWVQQFTLISFDTATLQLPPLTVQLHLGDTVQTNPLELGITTPYQSADLQDMANIRDIRREPVHWTDYWPWALGALVALIAIYRLLRRKRPKKPIPAAVPLAVPPPPAREVALQKLAELEQDKPWLRGELLEYYAQLSLIIREYLENQYQFPALESTTREILNFLKKTNFPDAQKPTLEFLLQQTDLVKFAEVEPPEQYHEQALEKAKTLVHG